MIIVEVIDSGVGISKQKLKDIFKLYSQIGQSQNIIQRNGIGLGLKTVKQIVEHLKGKVGITSVENKGTVIYFTMLKNMKHLLKDND